MLQLNDDRVLLVTENSAMQLAFKRIPQGDYNIKSVQSRNSRNNAREGGKKKNLEERGWNPAIS